MRATRFRGAIGMVEDTVDTSQRALGFGLCACSRARAAPILISPKRRRFLDRARTENDIQTHLSDLNRVRRWSCGRSSSIDHEFKEIAIRIANVNARSGCLTPALTSDRPGFHFRARFVERRFQRCGRAVPDKAQIAARRL